MKLVLASSSVYRRALLERLGIPFASDSPEIDETPLPDERPETLVVRLAHGKARRVAERRPQDLVVASDQTAVCAGRVLGKPGTPERAVEELTALSGNTVQFLTSLVVMTPDGSAAEHLDTTTVVFRELGRPEIEAYVAREDPVDCAGAIKSEGLGIALLQRIESVDPTALVGLPLIRLSEMLRAAGMDPLGVTR